MVCRRSPPTTTRPMPTTMRLKIGLRRGLYDSLVDGFAVPGAARLLEGCRSARAPRVGRRRPPSRGPVLAATGAGIGLIALAGWILPSAATVTPMAPPVVFPSTASPEALAAFAAAAIGMAGLVGAAPPTAGCRDVTAAAKSGLGGILLFGALTALTFTAAPMSLVEGDVDGASPLAGSLMGAATLAAALALGGLGVLGASRAFGAALARPARPFPTLASVRLARVRIAQAAVVVACAWADNSGLVDCATALIGAMALTLAMTAPIAALAATGRAGHLAAAAAALTAAALAAWRLIAVRSPPAATELLVEALAVGAAAFVVGSLVALVAPRRGPARRRARSTRSWAPHADAASRLLASS